MKKIIVSLALLANVAFAQQKQLTTNTGAPIGDNQNSQTAGPNGVLAVMLPPTVLSVLVNPKAIGYDAIVALPAL